MDLPKVLIDKFVAVTSGDSDDISPVTVYGTAKLENGNLSVQIDGSTNYIPVENTMEVEDGDRVTIVIDNHTATLTGNLTHPASQSVGKKYLKMTEQGLIVGKLENGEPSGAYTLQSDTGMSIIDGSGETLSSFSADVVSLGSNDNSIISLCNDKAEIKYEREDDTEFSRQSVTFSVVSEDSESAIRNNIVVESRSPLGYDYESDSENISYIEASTSRSNSRLDIVTRSESEGHLYRGSYIRMNNQVTDSTIEIYSNGQVDIYNESGDPVLYVNHNTLFTTRKIDYTDSKSYTSASYPLIELPLTDVPVGYMPIAITRIATNHTNLAHLTGFSIDGYNLKAWFSMEGSFTGLTVHFTCLFINTAIIE